MVVHQLASADQLLVPGGTPFAGSLPLRGDNGVSSFTFSIDTGKVVPLGQWCTIRDGGIRSPRT